MITQEQLYQLINYLKGSCITTDEAMNDLFELSEDDLKSEQIDELWGEIFKYSTCGWWCEMAEESGIDDSELICNDCAEDE